MLEKVIQLLEGILGGVPTYMRAERFSNNRNLNLKDMGNGKGIRQLTIRNIGDHFVILDDTKEVIPSGGSFTIFHNNRVVNERFPIVFGEIDPNSAAAINNTTPTKDAIVRYLVDVC